MNNKILSKGVSVGMGKLMHGSDTACNPVV